MRHARRLPSRKSFLGSDMQQPTGLAAPQQEPRTVDRAATPLPGGPLVIVGGCGHVGLPLGLMFARKGFQVELLDTSAERIASVNAGRMPFHEDDADELLGELVRAG